MRTFRREHTNDSDGSTTADRVMQQSAVPLSARIERRRPKPNIRPAGATSDLGHATVDEELDTIDEAGRV